MWVLASVMNGVVGKIYATYHFKEAKTNSRADMISLLNSLLEMRTFVVYMCVFVCVCVYVFLCVSESVIRVMNNHRAS